MNKRVVIIGAGPAGLTAASELVNGQGLKPVVFELDKQVGGISKTIVYKNNRMDIGGHRFFSKSDWVMRWWAEVMRPNALNPDANDDMLVRPRLSRIYFLRKFFDYPIKVDGKTIRGLGVVRLIQIALSYLAIKIFPIKKIKHLEDFYISRFGRALYELFFKDYTHKVWGVPCHEINPDWGAQRVKGLSITKALVHVIKGFFRRDINDVAQKNTNTSLIERFLYPKFGPGQLWETVQQRLEALGVPVVLNTEVVGIELLNQRVVAVKTRDSRTNLIERHECDYVISSMPIKDLVAAVDGAVPENVREVASKLQYRDFITVGVLAKELLQGEPAFDGGPKILPDTWIYIQERDVRVGRLQIFNNWSPWLVADSSTVWMGMEYFCTEGDDLWQMTDEELALLAKNELEKIGVVAQEAVLDVNVERIRKAYPAYFGVFERFDEIKDWADQIDNLFLVGRNGMHRYNNQDHSMLTAKLAAEAIMENKNNRSEIWAVNLDDEYHEEKAS